MKRKSLAVSFLFLTCGLAGCAEHDLKSGEVTQVAFTRDGKTLVVANEFRNVQGAGTKRAQAHCRLRSWTTADWKAVGDTGELSLQCLCFAPSNPDSWLFTAVGFHRFGSEGGNPFDGPRFCKFDPVTMDRKEMDVLQKGHENRLFSVMATAHAGDKPLGLVYGVCHPPATPRAHLLFVFDLKTGKKTVDLQDFHDGERSKEDRWMHMLFDFTPDGKHVISCRPCLPYQLQLHEAETGKLVKSLKIKTPVGSMKFSPDGKMLAAFCRDGAVLLLEPDLSKQILSKHIYAPKLERFGGPPKGIAFAGTERLVVLSSFSNVELFDTKELKSIRTFEGKKDRVNCLAASPDGKLLAVGFGETSQSPGFVRVWNVASGELLKELK